MYSALLETVFIKQITIEIKSKEKIQNLRVRSGLGFQAICLQHKTPIEFNCRKADCGICIFRVLEGAENLSPAIGGEKEFLGAMRADADERLACQVRVFGDVKIETDYL